MSYVQLCAYSLIDKSSQIMNNKDSVIETPNAGFIEVQVLMNNGSKGHHLIYTHIYQSTTHLHIMNVDKIIIYTY